MSSKYLSPNGDTKRNLAQGSRRVLLFGATGTVGAGALLECLDHPEIGEVLCVTRRLTGRTHPKLREIQHKDFLDFSALADDFRDVDACFWAIGVPSAGRGEQEYMKLTHDNTLAAARVLLGQSPHCCFVFVSGAGADETEAGRSMWARVKGKTENAILGMNFKRALVFRPGAIVAKRGIRHSVPIYGLSQILGPLMRPFGLATTTVEIGRAFVAILLSESTGSTKQLRLASREINELAQQMPGPSQKS